MRNEDQVEQTLIHGIQYSIKDMAEGSGDHCPVQPGSNLLEVRPDGQVFFDTAYKVNKKAEETGAEMLSPEGAVSDGRQISSASIQSIRERFALVNSSGFFSLLK